MAWFRNGTFTLSNGSDTGTITGAGATMQGLVRAGDRLKCGSWDEEIIAFSIDGSGNATVEFATEYAGSTITAQPYAIQPTSGFQSSLLAALNTITSNLNGYLAGPLAGKFPDGSAAAPALAFADDIDVGFYRAAANQLGVSIGGVARLLLSTSGATLNVPLQGTAVTQSATDTTAGRLMKGGDFGLGIIGTLHLLTDLDSSATAHGWHRAASTTANIGSRPAGASNAGIVFIERYDQNVVRQSYFDVLPPYSTWERRSIPGGTWTAWRRRLLDSDILGTVSQSGGVPTGAIIERGSNANGEYVRFADGTQICTYSAPAVNATEATGQMFRHTAALSWTYPAAFATTPIVTGGADQTQRWLVFGVPATSAVGYRVLSVLSDASAVSQRLVAIGRWF